MKVEFKLKYGINKITLNDGITLRFRAKYGKNVLVIPTPNDAIFLRLKYGTNVIEIPETAETTTFGTNLFKKKITIYNDVESDGINPRRFDRKVVELCNVQKGILQNADGTIEKVVNALTVITKDIKRYKTPIEYARIPADQKDNYFTANINDFVVLDEVDDVVTTAIEYRDLQKKYKDNGFSVTAVNEYLNGMTVDNVQIIHA